MAGNTSYQVEVTVPAQVRYEREVLLYLYTYFSLERAGEIDDNILESIVSLKDHPSRGTIEDQLSGNPQEYRFILYKETRNVEVKIIYYIEEQIKKVYVTDIFPVKKNPDQMGLRS